MSRSVDSKFTDEELDQSRETAINKVNDYLYLGNIDARRECERFNIKWIIRLTTEIEAANTQIDVPAEVNEKVFYILDDPSRLIEPIIRLSIPIIENAIANRQNILVHCQAGISRSASVVIGYIMKSKGMTAAQALNFVESKRCCIWPNSGFWRELTELTFSEDDPGPG